MRPLLIGSVLALASLAPGVLVGKGSARSAEGGVLEQRAAELTAGLGTRRLLSVKFDGASLTQIIDYLRIATGWNFVIKYAPIQKEGIDVATIHATLDLDDVPVGLVLELVLEPNKLAAKVIGNIVFITTKADAMGKPVFCMFPLSQLTWQKIDFHGPDIDLHPSDYTPIEDTPEVVVEDDPFLDPQHIVDLVKEMVDAPWDSEGWSISATKQFMTVKAPRSVLRQVAVAIGMMSAMK